MAGIGTIVNVMAIIAGGLCGLVTRRFLEERYQETIMKATGFAIIVMALGSTLSQMLVVRSRRREINSPEVWIPRGRS